MVHFLSRDVVAPKGAVVACDFDRSLLAARVLGDGFGALADGVLGQLTRYHHTVWRTWLFIAYSDEDHDHTTNLTYTSLIHFSLKVWENVLFELGSERVKCRKKAFYFSLCV